MVPLFEMLANAQNGNAIDQMAKQFGLSQKQTQDAMEALLPAFSQGLKRNTTTPNDVGSFLNALASGQHAKYFEDATRAFSSQGVEEGNGILGHLFGSKELSRAVAAQASQATGIAQQTLQQMLPALAAMIMGGLFKQTSGQMPGASRAGQGNPLHDMFEQMMRQAGGSTPTPRPEAPQPDLNQFGNPFGKILEGMFGGGQAQGRQSRQSPAGDNPLGRIFEEMLGGGRQEEAAPKPKSNPSGRARTPYDDLFGDLFDAGSKTRDNYQKNMESIFDQFLDGMKKRR